MNSLFDSVPILPIQLPKSSCQPTVNCNTLEGPYTTTLKAGILGGTRKSQIKQNLIMALTSCLFHPNTKSCDSRLTPLPYEGKHEARGPVQSGVQTGNATTQSTSTNFNRTRTKTNSVRYVYTNLHVRYRSNSCPSIRNVGGSTPLDSSPLATGRSSLIDTLGTPETRVYTVL